MERVRWWFNGRWGRMARRDVIIWSQTTVRYAVEARQGGADGRSRWLEVDDLDHGIRVAKDLMQDQDGWRELPTAEAPSSGE